MVRNGMQVSSSGYSFSLPSAMSNTEWRKTGWRIDSEENVTVFSNQTSPRSTWPTWTEGRYGSRWLERSWRDGTTWTRCKSADTPLLQGAYLLFPCVISQGLSGEKVRN